MITYTMQKSEMVWHGLLNCAEARVMSSVEERKLLVELVDCKERILKALASPDDEQWKASEAAAGFHQLIRDLAEPEETNVPRPTDAVRRLADRYQQIRAALAMANIRLVAHVAKRYQDRGIPPGDLIQEGFCALLVAIDRFDLVNESRLATYAIWWIRQAIQRAVASGAYPVRLNPRQLHLLAKAQGMAGDRGRDRATRTDRPGSAFSPIIEQLFAATRPVVSLDAPSRAGQTSSLGEFLIPPDEDDSPDDDASSSVSDLIKTLNAREQLVLKLRFGLGGESARTLVEVSQVVGVSKERVRQIQDRALAKLRAASADEQVTAASPSVSPSRSLSRRRG